MIRKILAASGAAIVLALPIAANAQMHPIMRHPRAMLFPHPGGAQRHCPADTVVSVNTETGIFHLRGSRFFNQHHVGSFACEHGAIRAGYHAARSGQ